MLLLKGSRVILATNRYENSPSNPIWCDDNKVIGTVCQEGYGIITVVWDNGKSNTYSSHDLLLHKPKSVNVIFNGKPGKVVCILPQSNYIVNFEEDMRGFSCDGKYKKGSCLVLNKTDVEKTEEEEN